MDRSHIEWGALPLIDWLWFLKNICRKDVLWYQPKQSIYELSNNFLTVIFWAGSSVKLIVLVASSSLCVFFLQSFFNLFLTMLPSWNLYAAQYQRKSHFWIYQEQNDMNFIKTKSCEKKHVLVLLNQKSSLPNIQNTE